MVLTLRTLKLKTNIQQTAKSSQPELVSQFPFSMIENSFALTSILSLTVLLLIWPILPGSHHFVLMIWQSLLRWKWLWYHRCPAWGMVSEHYNLSHKLSSSSPPCPVRLVVLPTQCYFCSCRYGLKSLGSNLWASHMCLLHGSLVSLWGLDKERLSEIDAFQVEKVSSRRTQGRQLQQIW